MSWCRGNPWKTYSYHIPWLQKWRTSGVYSPYIGLSAGQLDAFNRLHFVNRNTFTTKIRKTSMEISWWISADIMKMKIMVCKGPFYHYSDVVMGAMASQITGVSIAYSIVCSDTDQRKHQNSAALATNKTIHVIEESDNILMLQSSCRESVVGYNRMPEVICVFVHNT